MEEELYVKLEGDQLVTPPINKENIINYYLDKEAIKADGYKLFVPAEIPKDAIRIFHMEYEEGEDTITELVVYDETQEEAEARIREQRRRYLDALTLTPSDVERALYYSELHMDFDDLKAYLVEQAPQIDLKGLAIELRANNFYRGAVDREGRRIVDMIGLALGYSPEDMDYLFENKSLPVKDE